MQNSLNRWPSSFGETILVEGSFRHFGRAFIPDKVVTFNNKVYETKSKIASLTRNLYGLEWMIGLCGHKKGN